MQTQPLVVSIKQAYSIKRFLKMSFWKLAIPVSRVLRTCQACCIGWTSKWVLAIKHFLEWYYRIQTKITGGSETSPNWTAGNDIKHRALVFRETVNIRYWTVAAAQMLEGHQER